MDLDPTEASGRGKMLIGVLLHGFLGGRLGGITRAAGAFGHRSISDPLPPDPGCAFLREECCL